jgi:hypothetical protein
MGGKGSVSIWHSRTVLKRVCALATAGDTVKKMGHVKEWNLMEKGNMSGKLWNANLCGTFSQYSQKP